MTTAIGATAVHHASRPETIVVLSIILAGCIASFMFRRRLGGRLAEAQPTQYFVVYVAAPLVGAATIALILVGTILSPNA